ncbi:MAG: alpha/beta hydrolase [Balneolaceae bacterium]
MASKPVIERYFSTTGLIIGTLFFGLSMSPTLLPRPDTVQGVISGLAMASGYGVGVFVIFVWKYLQLPTPKKKVQKWAQIAAAVIFLLIAVGSLWQATAWQNSLREMMNMEQDASVQPLWVGVLALLIFVAVLAVARFFIWLKRLLAQKFEKVVPPRVSFVLGLTTTFILFWLIVNGVLFSQLLRLADSTYQQVDSVMEPDREQPMDSLKAGSPNSFLSWAEMGRQGRRFLADGPSARQIEQMTDTTAVEPIRVYVGMHASDSFQERAELALQELLRIGAFERSLLVLITPTGTGWVDPGSIEPLEYLHRGDVASVAAQYSYLPSPIALIAEEDYGSEMARALFQEIYGHWTSLPPDQRPKLYLKGLSLGALNSDRSFDLFDIINDPFHGVLWAGPPFRKTTWRTITNSRQQGSPAWLPRFRDDSVVRFGNQYGGFENGDAPWGDFRIAYLQYASDPIVFFEESVFTHEPEWMKGERAPDVSERLRWFPIVTGLQLAADMMTGTSPSGFGHEYAPEHYFDAWLALTEPRGWTDDQIASLRTYFRDKMYRSEP